MTSPRLPWPLLVLAALLVVAFTATLQHDPFFWDTVQLASKQAHFYYEKGCTLHPLPVEADSGHPPFLGMYLAAWWSLLGKSLPVSHWAMLPFLLANVWLLLRLGMRLAGPGWAAWLLPLVLLDPVVLGQSALVSPDVMLMTWFLLAVEGALHQKRGWVLVAVVGLCTISMRGMMTAAALCLWHIGWHFVQISDSKTSLREKRPLHLLLPFLPGFAAGAAFLLWHVYTTGWVGHHPDSPWAKAFVQAEGVGLLRNVAVLAWRWLDFGRWAVWVVSGVLIWRQRKDMTPATKQILLLLLCVTVCLSPSALLYTNLSAHRYFLPGFLSLHLLAFLLLTREARLGITAANRVVVVLVLLIISLATGNLWVYPRGISMDWDSTLAHLPYHRHRAEAFHFLEKSGIPIASVGSAFPNLNTGENLLLNGDTRQMAPFNQGTQTHVLVSNVFNDLNESDFRRLEQEWVLMRQWRHPVGVWLALWRCQPKG